LHNIIFITGIENKLEILKYGKERKKREGHKRNHLKILHSFVSFYWA
jgi:hypothetical protein